MFVLFIAEDDTLLSRGIILCFFYFLLQVVVFSDPKLVDFLTRISFLDKMYLFLIKKTTKMLHSQILFVLLPKFISIIVQSATVRLNTLNNININKKNK